MVCWRYLNICSRLELLFCLKSSVADEGQHVAQALISQDFAQTGRVQPVRRFLGTENRPVEREVPPPSPPVSEREAPSPLLLPSSSSSSPQCEREYPAPARHPPHNIPSFQMTSAPLPSRSPNRCTTQRPQNPGPGRLCGLLFQIPSISHGENPAPWHSFKVGPRPVKCKRNRLIFLFFLFPRLSPSLLSLNSFQSHPRSRD